MREIHSQAELRALRDLVALVTGWAHQLERVQAGFDRPPLERACAPLGLAAAGAARANGSAQIGFEPQADPLRSHREVKCVSCGRGQPRNRPRRCPTCGGSYLEL